MTSPGEGSTDDIPERHRVVLDASALVDLLAGTEHASAVRTRLTSTVMHAPAHLDVEVTSALGRLVRAELLDPDTATAALGALHRMPVTRHELPPLVTGAWARREYLRLSDAFYVELAAQLDMPLLTTDLCLARAATEAEPIPSTDTAR
jgi:predicted nucleic acid-binding protein